jgi:uncharacterized membrane protein (UPF0127 family)
MNRIFRGLTLLFILGTVAVSCNRTAPPSTAPSDAPIPITTAYNVPAKLGSAQLHVELADTDGKRQHGLSGREPLAEQQGMLFVFADTQQTRPEFWMKGMKFDLDLIWLKDNKVVDITPHVPAPKNENDALPSYAPSADVDMVLEVSSGWSERHDIKRGATLELQSVGQL